MHEDVSRSFRTGSLKRELQMAQLSEPLDAVVSLFCESVLWVLPPQSFVFLLNEYLLLLFISLSIQFGNFWLHPRTADSAGLG
jgi:hypothetical protein